MNLTQDENENVPQGRETKKRMIIDNKLRKMLVDTLPIGAHLTAIFDSCHSGTLLDLDHYLCNNIYFPWISPGFRNQNTLWRGVREYSVATPTAPDSLINPSHFRPHG